MLRYVIINTTMNFVFHSSEILVGINNETEDYCDVCMKEDCKKYYDEVCEKDGVKKVCAQVDDNLRSGCPAFTIRFSINEDIAGSMNVHNYYNSCFYTYLFV